MWLARPASLQRQLTLSLRLCLSNHLRNSVINYRPGAGEKGDLLLEPVVVVPEPDPPALAESCANPIEGGLARKTEYTFFWKGKNMSRSMSDSCCSIQTNQKSIPNYPSHARVGWNSSIEDCTKT